MAVEWGSLGDAWAHERGLHISRQETADAALTAVTAGDADAAIVDAVTVALTAPPGLVIRTPPLQSDPYVIVLPHDSPKLADAVDAALAALMSDGAWQRLVEQYFPMTPPDPLATPEA